MKIPSLLGRLLRTALVLVAASAGSAWAQAPWTSLSLVFTEPTGVVGPTDSIPVNLRLTNNDPGLDFVVNNDLPNGGLDTASLPTGAWVYNANTQGYDFVEFASYTSFWLTTGFGCSGTFTAPGQCTQGPPYTFSFAANDHYQLPFSLAPGATLDYLFGTFTPTAGAVAPGTYEFYRAVLWLDVNGLDASGNALNTVVFPTVTCPYDNALSCADINAPIFTRVVEVPEPAPAVLLGLGLVALAGWRTRRLAAVR